ncbi:MAG: UDP-2,3-diacylglucosamine diphosphatase, partial [Mucinivorans sp.]
MAVYMASDIHLGLEFGTKSPKEREKQFVDWLRSIENDCSELFLVGDIFDFFFEWKHVVPKGAVRTLAALSALVDRGVEVHFFPGNHDLWVNDYLSKECGIIIERQPMIRVIGGYKFFIAHGDDYCKHGFFGAIIFGLFHSSWARKIGSWLIHPDLLMAFGLRWSLSNRLRRGGVAHIFGREDDFLVSFARKYLVTVDSGIDYFVFGHEHTPLIYRLNETSQLVILGEWLANPMVVCVDEGGLVLVGP